MLGGGVALPFRIGREACPIFLGPNILSRLIFLDLFFCLFKFIFLGSHWSVNLYFWINLAYSKEEWKKDSKWIVFKAMLTVCSLPYKTVEHLKCLTYIFGYLLPTTFAKDYIFGSSCQTLGHVLLPKLVSTDPPPWENYDLYARKQKLHNFPEVCHCQ